jgi:hypothetical protein
MKASEFKDALDTAASLTTPETAGQLRVLAGLFATAPDKTVAAMVTQLGKAALVPEPGSPSITDFIGSIGPLQKFVGEYGKPAFAKDLHTVTALLQRFSEAGVQPFVDKAAAALSKPTRQPPALRDDVVQRHLGRLEQTLGDDAAFTIAYNELDRDPELGKLEIAELAKRFTQTSAKSRATALKKNLVTPPHSYDVPGEIQISRRAISRLVFARTAFTHNSINCLRNGAELLRRRRLHLFIDQVNT